MPRTRTSDIGVLFGTMVNRRRLARGWTLADLARVSGFHPTWLGVLERGENLPGLPTILRLAEVLGVGAAELVSEVEAGWKAARAERARRLQRRHDIAG
jgi:transcriptional regulator with XRE-family HTH domain